MTITTPAAPPLPSAHVLTCALSMAFHLLQRATADQSAPIDPRANVILTQRGRAAEYDAALWLWTQARDARERALRGGA